VVLALDDFLWPSWQQAISLAYEHGIVIFPFSVYMALPLLQLVGMPGDRINLNFVPFFLGLGDSSISLSST